MATDKDLERKIRKKLLKDGCGNHDCYFVKPKGMGTNGPCNCIVTVMYMVREHIADN